MSKANPTAREQALENLGTDTKAMPIILEALKTATPEQQKQFAEKCIMEVYPKKKQYIILPDGKKQLKTIKDRKTGEYKHVPDFVMVEDKTATPKKEINVGKAKTWYLDFMGIESKKLPKREKSNYELYLEALNITE